MCNQENTQNQLILSWHRGIMWGLVSHPTTAPVRDLKWINWPLKSTEPGFLEEYLLLGGRYFFDVQYRSLLWLKSPDPQLAAPLGPHTRGSHCWWAILPRSHKTCWGSWLPHTKVVHSRFFFLFFCGKFKYSPSGEIRGTALEKEWSIHPSRWGMLISSQSLNYFEVRSAIFKSMKSEPRHQNMQCHGAKGNQTEVLLSFIQTSWLFCGCSLRNVHPVAVASGHFGENRCQQDPTHSCPLLSQTEELENSSITGLLIQ